MSTVDAKLVETTSATRVITIVTTRGEKVKINFSGTEFSDLKELLQRGGTDVNGNRFSSYDLSNMKCVEGVNKTTLEHPKAVVPDGDFNLFLMPYKSKSGGHLNRVDCYTKIKKFINKDNDKAIAHFNTSKNYTNKSTEELNQLIESYNPGTAKKATKEKSEAIVDVATSFLEAGSADEAVSQLQGLSVDQKLDVIAKILYTSVNSNAIGTVTSTAPAIKSQEEIEEEERKAKEKADREEADRKDKEENKQLQNEMSDLMQGFSDVRR